ncbi:MAG TPA: hypothetical protein VFI46_18675 [Jiangellaceae bacterium]|nr:hypothetical protein [Jiangellaceae bacterium]
MSIDFGVLVVITLGLLTLVGWKPLIGIDVAVSHELVVPATVEMSMSWDS